MEKMPQDGNEFIKEEGDGFVEGTQQPLPGMEDLMAHLCKEHQARLVEGFDSNRINMQACATCSSHELARDLATVHKLSEKFQAGQEIDPSSGKVAEALVYSLIAKGALGKEIVVRPASIYDDYINGVDLLLDNLRMRDPIVSAVDVTINQNNSTEGKREAYDREGKEVKDGLIKKLERARNRIDLIASFTPEEARLLSAWISAGGLTGEHADGHNDLPEKAKKILLVKYYDAPVGHEYHGRPHPVIAGPQIVLSLDGAFVQRAVTDPLRVDQHESRTAALIAAEMDVAVRTYTSYIKQVITKKGANALLEQLWVAGSAWSQQLARDDSRDKVAEGKRLVKNDEECREQMETFLQALNKVYGKH